MPDLLSLLKTSLGDPFVNPFRRVSCERDVKRGLSLSPKSLVEGRTISAASASESGSVEFGSNKFFLLCGIGGAISCGLTHTAIVPLDLVKCRMQVDSKKYSSIAQGFKVNLS